MTTAFRTGALVALSSVAGLASAGTLNVTGMVPGKSRLIDLAIYGNARQLEAGPQAANYDGREFEGYCIDLSYTQQIPSTFSATPRAASGFLPEGDRIAKLVNQYAAGVTGRDQGAALQLAIWDILVDGGDGADAGDFRASNLNTGTQGYFEGFLADPLIGVSNVATVYDPDSHGTNHNVNQGLIEAVPEPASMIALGLGGLALLRRRKKSS
ncbi:PEP-CTERM sorting domain-containing protein [bacterium]|nr:MAG: PEP-CTERM sorting domain-containing protein [bacterium]